jgi:adenosylmethionine-8-amino-7-oxononanoate aminotransferase
MRAEPVEACPSTSSGHIGTSSGTSARRPSHLRSTNEASVEHTEHERGEGAYICVRVRPALPIVGDVRGDGYFYAVELVKGKATKETLDADEVERVLRGYVAGALYENGLYCRTDDRGNAVVQVAPPLICGQAEFDEMEQILRHVLDQAWTKL